MTVAMPSVFLPATMTVPVAAVPFSIAMAMALMFLFVMAAMAVPMIALSFPMSATVSMAATMTMVTVAGGMTWRRHRHHQQNDGSQDVETGDVEEG